MMLSSLLELLLLLLLLLLNLFFSLTEVLLMLFCLSQASLVQYFSTRQVQSSPLFQPIGVDTDLTSLLAGYRVCDCSSISIANEFSASSSAKEAPSLPKQLLQTRAFRVRVRFFNISEKFPLLDINFRRRSSVRRRLAAMAGVSSSKLQGFMQASGVDIAVSILIQSTQPRNSVLKDLVTRNF
jgi:hypothetical protein